MSGRVRTLIVDDHPAFRQGLRQVIANEPRFEVVGEAHDGVGGLHAAKTTQPELMILDINLPGLNGLEVARQLLACHSPTKVIIMTMHTDEEYFHKALNLEVKGYLLKDSALSEIASCMKTVAAGDYYLTPSMSACLLKRRKRLQALEVARPAVESLTTGERRVLRRIADNRTSKEIAREFGISHRTVEAHRANMCKKLELQGCHCLLQFSLEHRAEL